MSQRLLQSLRVVLAAFSVAAGIGALPCIVTAQSGTLPHPGAHAGPLRLPNNLFYLPPPPVRQIQVHDIVTVVVNVSTQVLSEGEVQRRKQANVDSVLADWLGFSGLSLKPANQTDGDLRVRASLNGRFRAEGELETRDRMQFTIAATVTDVRPNGKLVIEAQQIVTNNREVWKQSLRGIARAEDVLQNNRLLSENIANLHIVKEEMGMVPSSYQRGWLFRAWDYVRPF